MTQDKTPPRFIELIFGNQYAIRLYKTDDKMGGEPIYRMQGTPQGIEAMQADIDSVFPRTTTSG